MTPFVDPTPGLQVVEPAPKPPNALPPSTWPTVGQLKAWTITEAADAAFHACNVLAEEYVEGTFGAWLRSYLNGQIHGPAGLLGDPEAVPPAPPAGAKAQLSITGLSFDLIQTGGPVCSVPPYTKIPPPQDATGHGGDMLANFRKELAANASAPSQFTKATGVGEKQIAPDGSTWIRIMGFLLCALLLSASAGRAFAQVNLRFVPEPMAVPASVLANARDMGRWAVLGCNDGVTVVSIASERIDMAAGKLRLISQDDALLVLNGHVKRSPAAKVAHVLSLAGQGVALGLSASSVIKNPLATAALGVGSALIPSLLTIAQGEVPNAVPLQSPLRYPLTLAPGQCFTDYRFAAKMRSPEVVTGTIK